MQHHTETLTGFFHPLDMVGWWNRLYGRNGFIQYQFVVPDNAVDTLRSIVEKVAAHGHASFVNVLKRFGPGSGGYLSFPTSGWTLTIDVPAGVDGLDALLNELDEMILCCRRAALPRQRRTAHSCSDPLRIPATR